MKSIYPRDETGYGTREGFYILQPHTKSGGLDKIVAFIGSDFTLVEDESPVFLSLYSPPMVVQDVTDDIPEPALDSVERLLTALDALYYEHSRLLEYLSSLTDLPPSWVENTGIISDELWTSFVHWGMNLIVKDGLPPVNLWFYFVAKAFDGLIYADNNSSQGKELK